MSQREAVGNQPNTTVCAYSSPGSGTRTRNRLRRGRVVAGSRIAHWEELRASFDERPRSSDGQKVIVR